MKCCGKLESLGLQHSVPAFRQEQFLPHLPSTLRSLKLSVCEAVGDMVMGRYKELKKLDLEFITCPDIMMPNVLGSAIIAERSNVLREVSEQRIMPSSYFVCLE